MYIIYTVHLYIFKKLPENHKINIFREKEMEKTSRLFG